MAIQDAEEERARYRELLMTPTMYHRMTPHHDREQRIKLGVRLTVAGMSLSGVVAGTAALLWFVLPLIRRER